MASGKWSGPPCAAALMRPDCDAQRSLRSSVAGENALRRSCGSLATSASSIRCTTSGPRQPWRWGPTTTGAPTSTPRDLPWRSSAVGSSPRSSSQLLAPPLASWAAPPTPAARPRSATAPVPRWPCWRRLALAANGARFGAATCHQALRLGASSCSCRARASCSQKAVPRWKRSSACSWCWWTRTPRRHSSLSLLETPSRWSTPAGGGRAAWSLLLPATAGRSRSVSMARSTTWSRPR
mmetsp:Transcript_82975/g.268459  ORF Transcript_82975/g.268459 Transcript_82975/m.268459 type:complete len:238 (-) Transcript_82975:1368-2081(-)